MICDFVIAIFSAALSESTFISSVLLLRRQVRWGLPPRAHSRVLGYLSVGQLVVSVFAELAARVPRKMLVFEGIVINFAKRKKKKASPSSPPAPLRVERGVISEIPLS